jgi:hypothetical protein
MLNLWLLVGLLLLLLLLRCLLRLLLLVMLLLFRCLVGLAGFKVDDMGPVRVLMLMMLVRLLWMMV